MQRIIQRTLTSALKSAYPQLPESTTAAVTLSKVPNVDYGDASALRLAKVLSSTPKQVAKKIMENISSNQVGKKSIIGSIDLTDKGFLNITVSNHWLCNEITSVAFFGMSYHQTHTLSSWSPEKIVVDFASPNVGKQLHAGHLRSSVIGDTISNIFEYQGNEVLRYSHVGDIGLPVALLVAHGLDTNVPWMSSMDEDSLLPTSKELSNLYIEAKKRSTDDIGFHQSVLSTLNLLQKGAFIKSTEEGGTIDEQEKLVKNAWKRIKDASRLEHNLIFQRLNVTVNEKPESLYTPYLEDVVNELLQNNIATISEGATCVFPIDTKEGNEKKRNKKKKQKRTSSSSPPPSPPPPPPPMLIKKTDGSWLYGTIDLAAIRQRLVGEKADRVVYVTDEGQRFHFSQVFDVARRSSWHHSSFPYPTTPANEYLQHVGFGLVKDLDGKKLSSRDGGALSMNELLDLASQEAKKALHRNTNIDDDDDTSKKTPLPPTVDSVITTKVGKRKMLLSDAVGTSALRYYDLRAGRKSYKLDFDSMLAFRGNTSVYLQYALTRIKSIQRKVMEEQSLNNFANEKKENKTKDLIVNHSFDSFETDIERKLAMTLMKFNDVIDLSSSNLTPHIFCEYLYNVAKTFHSFYEKCPVKNSKQVQDRLILLKATEKVLSTGMRLLGVIELDRM
jgi:arginyl-tRNA synthetase